MRTMRGERNLPLVGKMRCVEPRQKQRRVAVDFGHSPSNLFSQMLLGEFASDCMDVDPSELLARCHFCLGEGAH